MSTPWHMRRKNTPMGPRTAQAWELFQQRKTYREIAEAMGVKRTSIGLFVREARMKLGIQEWRAPVTFQDEPLEEDGEMDTTPGCERCGLRGEHECLPTRADAYLRQADGEWYADRRYR